MSDNRNIKELMDEQVVDFNEVRTRKMEEKRRKTERIFFRQLLGIYSVVGEGGGMRPIEIVDVSEEGLAFQVQYRAGDHWPQGEKDLVIRLYFSQDTYVPVHLKVQNSRPCVEEGVRYTRYGCLVDQTVSSSEAYLGFVRFLKAYAEHAHKDTGSASFFYL